MITTINMTLIYYLLIISILFFFKVEIGVYTIFIMHRLVNTISQVFCHIKNIFINLKDDFSNLSSTNELLLFKDFL